MYEAHYGLNAKPFQLTPDPEFFFASTLHKRAMSYLEYGLSQAEGFIVITGGIGTGKTTIANSLLANLQGDIVAAQIVTPKLSPDDVVKMVATKFGVDVTDKSKTQVLDELEQYLYALAKDNKRALLLVDEAQNLPLETIEELRMLSNFQQAGKPLLQSFLLGQEELQPILRAPNMEQFRQRIVASCHLAPLNAEETVEYIKYRMTSAGWEEQVEGGDLTLEKQDLFSADALQEIYLFTKGIPRKINTFMDRVLLFGFLEDMHAFNAEDIKKVVAEVSAEMFTPEENEQALYDLQQGVRAFEGQNGNSSAAALANTTTTAAPKAHVDAGRFSEDSGRPHSTAPRVARSSATIPTKKLRTEELLAAEDIDVTALQESLLSETKRRELAEYDIEYYKTMLDEMVFALDDAIANKLKLTQYIDKLLKRKYQTYVKDKESQ